MSTATKRPPIDENATPWVEGLTIPQVLAETAAPLSATTTRWCFRRSACGPAIAEFSRQVDEAARGLVALGIKHGEHVAIWATNVPAVGRAAIRHRADRRGAGQHQSGLPARSS